MTGQRMNGAGTTRRGWLAAGAGLALPAPGRPAAAQPAYPTRPVRVVVCWSAGGGVDSTARRLGARLSEQMGQPFVIENRPGATGSIGAAEVARAAPDGHTLLCIDNSYATLPYLFSRLPFDQPTAFRPISIAAVSPLFLGVAANSPHRDLAGFIAAAKAQPDRISYGTGGNGSAPHFATVAFERASGTKLFHVPFRGANEAVLAVLSGTVDAVIVSIGSALGSLQGGQLRPLAISGNSRVAALPNTPTFAEAGLPGYGVVSWYGLAAPRGTPEPIVARLHAEMLRAIATEDFKSFLTSVGSEPGGLEPDAFARLIGEETALWRDVALSGGIERQ
ncbi:Bug family tripartite tricarboxylate transporter substrate binding protein [Muricoccus radiodurans]|uniref:Bug family tripartite tricarboxylate transporter substrate binding protein n=1 Tax=Muricoccus radiodurans TaxID=2231721 RepID=UPI003CEC2C4F